MHRFWRLLVLEECNKNNNDQSNLVLEDLLSMVGWELALLLEARNHQDK